MTKYKKISRARTRLKPSKALVKMPECEKTSHQNWNKNKGKCRNKKTKKFKMEYYVCPIHYNKLEELTKNYMAGYIREGKKSGVFYNEDYRRLNKKAYRYAIDTLGYSDEKAGEFASDVVKCKRKVDSELDSHSD